MKLFGRGSDKDKEPNETQRPSGGEGEDASTNDDAVNEVVIPQAKTISEGPYLNSEEHLWHAMAWADQFVRAQTLRWRYTIAASKAEQFWGMVHVTEDEISAYLKTAFMRPNELPSDLITTMQPYWKAAQNIARDIANRCKQTPVSIPLRLVRLETMFGLSTFDLAVLLVCMLPELDGRYRRLFGYLQDDASRTRPSVELILQILQPAATEGETLRSAFNETAPLRKHHLLNITDLTGANDPLSARALHADARIVDFLLGSNKPDNRLRGFVSEANHSFAMEDLLLEETQLAQLYSLSDWLTTTMSTQSKVMSPAIYLHGPYGSGRLSSAQAICHRLGMPLLIVDTKAMLQSPGWGLMINLVLRESILRGGAVYWTNTQVLRDREQAGDQWDYLVNVVEEHRGLVFLAGETPWDPAGHFRQKEFTRLDFTTPGYILRQQLWAHYLPPTEAFAEPAPDRLQLANVLANGFQLTGGQIVDAVATAESQALQRDPSTAMLVVDDLYEGCRRQSSRGLITFARLIEPRSDLSFDDLILPAANKRQLNELRDRIRYRSQVYTGMGFERRLSLGRGLIALFTGSSGTGKTMAAELLGREYGMQIYKVDLAAVVSKYVGETEKNLAQVFNEAEDANAILLFDEGEALFGKRGEVKEARDRWANTEVNYLLQRIEEFRGVVIITTNFRQNMDPAFLRRIHVAVDFPRPEAEARLRIWQGMFPQGVERPNDEELMALAEQFTLSGGSIKNVVVNAAFRAVTEAGPEGTHITVRHLVLGIAREEQKTAKALTRGDFGDTYYAWVEEEIL